MASDLLFVNGTLMRGLALHANLDGAQFIEEAMTAPTYRIHSIGDVHPGMYLVNEGGVSVPGDLSIVAFDDSILTQLMHPALTALSRDTFDFSRQAAEVLLQTIADPGTVINRRSSDPVLTVRESTAPPA